MKIKEWVEETDASVLLTRTTQESLVNQIRRRAWEYFDRKIGNQWLLRVTGLAGKVEKIFTDIFGPRLP